MPLVQRTDAYVAIQQSASNAMLLMRIEDSWANRVVFYSGMLHSWKSEPIQDHTQQAYNILLQKMIDEAAELRDATTFVESL